MYGDAAISFSGSDFVRDSDIDEFHTYRFESLDGINYRISVDGLVFMGGVDSTGPTDTPYLQLTSRGECDGFPNTLNEWDFVRY